MPTSQQLVGSVVRCRMRRVLKSVISIIMQWKGSHHRAHPLHVHQVRCANRRVKRRLGAALSCPSLQKLRHATGGQGCDHGTNPAGLADDCGIAFCL
mmetsp:Transcript_22982/g.42282  ORF Transcript_22982/g.42282 Transcript_22982/m.42282 type:complete len:97 (+) Transcript_22982:1125-1415(+)